VGALTGLAALFGLLMNFNYLLAGAVSLNPIMLLISVLLIVAWRTAGWWGLDRWILSILGPSWRVQTRSPEHVNDGRRRSEATSNSNPT
jgi:thiosulfate dehydrogenase [quinone] large subunit